MAKTDYKVYVSVSLAMVMWSMTFIWFKIANETYHPFTIVFGRLLISSILLFLIALFSRLLQKIQKKDIKYMIILSLFNPILYFLAESYGLTLVSASLGAVIISTIPLLVPVGATIFFKERLTLINIAGMVISFSGVLVVIMNKGFSLVASPIGIFVMFLAVICAVGYTLMVKRLTYSYSPYTITAYQSIFGAIIFLPLFLIFDLDHFMTAGHNFRAVSTLVYLAIFGSILAFIFFNYSVKVLGAAKTDFFTNIIPVLTVVFAYFILGEPVGIRKVAGIAIVLTGLFMSQTQVTNRKKSRYVSP